MIFLRPWGLALILIPFLLLFWRRNGQETSVWTRVIDKKLLPYLLISDQGHQAKKRWGLFNLALWILLSIAMAGPAWNKEIVPTQVVKPATVIVMELSPALTGADLKRAQQKLHDLLALLQDDQVALVLFDRFGYTATPLTFETDIIRQMIPYLEPGLLPETQVEPLAGFRQADLLFQNAGVDHGRILFITAGTNISSDLIRWAQNSPHTIGILGIGSDLPHPVPLPTGGFLSDSEGRALMVSLNEPQLREMGSYQSLTTNDSDIEVLLKETDTSPTGTGTHGSEASQWQDCGPFILIWVLPFFALLFRRGAFVMIVLLMTLPVQAGLWYRPDQEVYHRQMQAVEAYRSGQYEKAGALFHQGQTPDDLYNTGNALAFQGKVDEAIAVYNNLLQQNPNHEDARYNKTYLEQQRQEQQSESQQESAQDQSESQKAEKNTSSTDQENKGHKEDSDSEAISNDSPDSLKEQPQPSQKDENASETTEEEDSKSTDSQSGQEEASNDQLQPIPAEQKFESTNNPIPDSTVFDQESEQILNKLPQDEARVLRYRIRKQYQRYIKGQN